MLFNREILQKLKDKLIDEFLTLKNSFSKDITNNIDIEFENEEKFKMLRGLVDCMENIFISPVESLYEKELRKLIVDSTKEYYSNHVTEWLKVFILEDYIRQGSEKINKEEMLFTEYVPLSTRTDVIRMLEDMIFYNNSKLLLDPQMYNYFSDDKLHILKEIYQIFSKNQSSIPILINIYKNYVKKNYKDIISKYLTGFPDPDSKTLAYNSDYVMDFKEFYSRQINICEKAFESNNLFLVSLREVVENIQLNEHAFNNSYIIPYYLDRLLVKKNNISSEKLRESIRHALDIFPSLPDKDIFIEGHRSLVEYYFYLAM